MQLSEFIKSRRKKCTMSQNELAQKCDVSRMYISRLERGQAVPDVLTLFRIGRALGMSEIRMLVESGLID